MILLKQVIKLVLWDNHKQSLLIKKCFLRNPGRRNILEGFNWRTFSSLGVDMANAAEIDGIGT